jgi:hypothetical protein
LHRTIGVTYRTAWFMFHRIREAMRAANPEPMGGPGKVVEADETYVGGKPRKGGVVSKTGRGTKKTPVVLVVERDGRARAKPVTRVDAKTLHAHVRDNVAKGTDILTDELFAYRGVAKEVEGMHFTVNHGRDEFAREDIHVNTAESFFALLKRGVYGSFHHVSKEHLSRYCDEFSFRWDHRDLDDAERTIEAIKGAEGKRLTYRQPRSPQ